MLRSYLLTLFIVVLVLVACNQPKPTPAAVATKTPTATSTSTSTPQPTFTPTVIATATPVPTATNTATATPTPAPTWQIPVLARWDSAELLTQIRQNPKTTLGVIPTAMDGNKIVWSPIYAAWVIGDVVYDKSERTHVFKGWDADSGQLLIEIDGFTSELWPWEDWHINADKLYIGSIEYTDDDKVAHLQVYQLPDLTLHHESSIPASEIHISDAGIFTEESNQIVAYALDGAVRWKSADSLTCRFIDNNLYEQLLVVLCDGAPTLIDVQSGTILAAWQTTVDIPDTNYSDISVADQQLYVQRNFGDFWQHRLALEAYNLTSGQLLWSFPLQDNINEPFDVGYAAFNDSVVVWETASLRRLDGATGQIVWKSEVASQSIDALLLVNDMVLVGTNTGFIHALDFESGELLWEQDVWATIDSKATVLRFVDFTGDTLLLSNGLGLTLSDNQHVESDQPERTYTPPPPIVAVETPPNIPEITFENNLFPEPPENKADWIPLIVAFLNANEVNFGRIPYLLQEWTDNSYFNTGHPIADLNGDQQPELFLQIAAERPPDLYPPCEYPFHSAIISKNQAGEYAIAFYWRLYSVHAPNIEDSADLTGDNLPDIALAISCGGNNTSQTFLAMIGWNGSAYHFLSDTPIGIGYTNLAIPHINEAGIYELQASVGGYGVFPIQVENIYTWDNTQDQFVRTNSQLTRPQGATAFALAGAHALQRGDYAQAISHHLDVLQSLDATYKYARLSAFSEFQLVLAYVLADDFAEAERWALSRDYADQPYALVKDVFWEAFVESGDYVISAEAARRQIRLLGTQKSQLLIVTHYTDPDFISLDEIVPCKACLEKAWNYNSPYIFNP